jgi:hypothetical protein
MSLRFLASFNSPPIVAATGAVVAVALPFVQAGGISLGILQLANVVTFAVNVVAVSVPGRIDGQQDAKMRRGDLNPQMASETEPLSATSTNDRPENDAAAIYNNTYSTSQGKTLLAPAGWAFTIWAPIFLGEAVFCGAQFLVDPVINIVPQVAAPFCAANLFQSLWCASFRPSYAQGWHKYVSVAMLGGTAFALSHLPADALLSTWYLIPMTMHFGWTTAATLVNFNGSLAMEDSVSDTTMIAVGHTSSILATAVGVGLTVFHSLPVYGYTLSWALAACAAGMTGRCRVLDQQRTELNPTLDAGAKVQRILCLVGSALCAGAATWTYFL